MTIAMGKSSVMMRRGFATIVALFLIALVGVALAGLTLRLSADARRTAKEASDSQLWQLLLAGEVKAREMRGRAGDTTPIIMTPPISGENAQVIIRSTTDGKSGGVSIEVRLGTKDRHEQIRDGRG
jgi:type II secretory pathway component PulK